MAKIKKIETATLHLTSKHVTGQVHPRLQKHTRVAPKSLGQRDLITQERLKRIQKMKDLKKQESKEAGKESAKERESQMEKAYNFPFDKGYLDFLMGNKFLDYRNQSPKRQEELANDQRMQDTYERNSGISYKDGSALAPPSHPLFSGFTTSYVKWVEKEMGHHWAMFADAYEKDPNSQFGKMAINILNNSKLQTQYKDATGETATGKKEEEKKEPSFTAEYRAWVKSELNPKSPHEEEQLMNDPKAQGMYNQKTGKNAKG